MKKEFRIPFHSMVDLITNSSSVIYTYYDGCVEPLKQMITEFCKISGFNKTFDEMFECHVISDSYIYEQFFDEADEDDMEKMKKESPEITDFNSLHKFLKDVNYGKKQKPEWMETAEEWGQNQDYNTSNSLVLIAKLPEYEKLGQMIIEFVTSVDMREGYNG